MNNIFKSYELKNYVISKKILERTNVIEFQFKIELYCMNDKLVSKAGFPRLV